MFVSITSCQISGRGGQEAGDLVLNTGMRIKGHLRLLRSGKERYEEEVEGRGRMRERGRTVKNSDAGSFHLSTSFISRFICTSSAYL